MATTSFRLSNGMGDSIDSPSQEQMRDFLNALDPNDLEHGAAWVATDDEHNLEWNVDGRLTWNSPDAPIRHLLHVSHEHVLRLWNALTSGDVEQVAREQWRPGNGWVETPEWRASKAEYQRELDEQYWNALTENDPTRICEREGCSRFQLLTSKLCRVHQFEAGRGKPCPFV